MRSAISEGALSGWPIGFREEAVAMLSDDVAAFEEFGSLG